MVARLLHLMATLTIIMAFIHQLPAHTQRDISRALTTTAAHVARAVS